MCVFEIKIKVGNFKTNFTLFFMNKSWFFNEFSIIFYRDFTNQNMFYSRTMYIILEISVSASKWGRNQLITPNITPWDDWFTELNILISKTHTYPIQNDGDRVRGWLHYVGVRRSPVDINHKLISSKFENITLYRPILRMMILIQFC